MVFHRTDEPRGEAILRDGFRDATGRWGFVVDEPLTGVWVTFDEPWDEVVSPRGEFLIAIDAPVDLLAEYEWVEEGRGYREALVPAEVLNRHSMRRVWQCADCGTLTDARLCPDCR